MGFPSDCFFANLRHVYGDRGPAERQDPAAGQGADLHQQDCRGGPADPGAAAARRQPLDSAGDGEGGGVGVATVQRIWVAHGLSPHRWRIFKLSKDSSFVEKLHDIVGLYVSPPAHAVVLSFDENSRIQALDRTQPGLPMKKGRLGTQTHDYKRNGTTALFAALSMLDGKVIGDCMPRHRHQEFIRFLNKIDAETPAGLDLHLIVDNYSTHKHPKVKAWFKRHPRFHQHFVPTSSSWLNMVERWFRNLTDKRTPPS